MVVCPQCGCPQVEDLLVIGEWDRSCDMCSWKGKSSELVTVEGSDGFKDPRAFIEFMRFLQRKIAPQVGAELVRLELVTKDHTPGNLAHITKLLVGFSRAGFEAVLKGVLSAGEEQQDVLDG